MAGEFLQQFLYFLFVGLRDIQNLAFPELLNIRIRLEMFNHERAGIYLLPLNRFERTGKRIFAGHAKPGEVLGKQASPGMWVVIAVLFLIPIVMLVLSLVLPYPAIRWVNIIVAIFLVVLNLFGLPYEGAYDNFLIIVSFVFNGLTVWYAWKWVI